MRITIGKGDILNLGIIAGLAYLCYKAYKVSNEETKKFKAHKDTKLAGRNLDKEIDEASIKNEHISDIEQRAYAKKILYTKKRAVITAGTIKEFDRALDIYDQFLNCMLSDPAEVAMAEILYEKTAMETRERERQFERQLASEKTQSREVASAIRSLSKSAAEGIQIELGH